MKSKAKFDPTNPHSVVWNTIKLVKDKHFEEAVQFITHIGINALNAVSWTLLCLSLQEINAPNYVLDTFEVYTPTLLPFVFNRVVIDLDDCAE